MGNIDGPLNGVDLLTSVSEGEALASDVGVDGTYVVKESNVQRYVAKCSMQSINDVDALYQKDRRELYRTVAEMFLSMFFKIFALQAQRDSDNSASQTTFPAILPHQIYALRPRHFFFDVLKTQRDRLSGTHNASDLVRLEDKFCKVRRHILSSRDAQRDMSVFKNCT